jgi:hypothetical protein
MIHTWAVTALRASAAAFLLVSFLAACAAAPTSKNDFDPSHNFGTYQSFAWLSENPMKVGSVASAPRAELQSEIMAAIREQLESKGLEFVEDSSAADFMISFTVGSREKMGPDTSPSVSSEPRGRGGWSTALSSGQSLYVQGVLAIDVIDVAERRPVWHGVAGKTISEVEREDMQRVVNAVVASILADFPPK